MNMNRHMHLIGALTIVAFSPVALGKEPAKESYEAPSSATLEMVDQNKTIKIACDTFQFESRPPNESDNGESTFLDCRTPVDANAPVLWDYVSKKRRLEKAVLSVKPGKGRPYTLELPNAAIVYAGVLDISTLSINLSATNSRLTVAPR